MQEEKPSQKFELDDNDTGKDYSREESHNEIFDQESQVYMQGEPPVMQMQKPRVAEKKKKAKKKQVAYEAKQENNIDNWFSRQFGRFFDDGSDQSLENDD